MKTAMDRFGRFVGDEVTTSASECVRACQGKPTRGKLAGALALASAFEDKIRGRLAEYQRGSGGASGGARADQVASDIHLVVSLAMCAICTEALVAALGCAAGGTERSAAREKVDLAAYVLAANTIGVDFEAHETQ